MQPFRDIALLSTGSVPFVACLRENNQKLHPGTGIPVLMAPRTIVDNDAAAIAFRSRSPCIAVVSQSINYRLGAPRALSSILGSCGNDPNPLNTN